MRPLLLLLALPVIGGLATGMAFAQASPDDADPDELLLRVLGQDEGEDDDDDEDEEEVTPETELTKAIQRRMRELTAADRARYDGKVLKLSYKNPDRFESDVIFPGPVNGEHYTFDRQVIRGLGRERNTVPVCFEGNTNGAFVLKPQFVNTVEIVAEIQFMYVLRGASFQTLLHHGDEGYWANDLGVHVIHKRAKKKPKKYRCSNKEFSRPASKWLDKVGRTEITFRYDNETDIVSVKSNGSLMREVSLAKDKKKNPELRAGGRVGFSWNSMIFVVREVHVTGELDRSWAADTLSISQGKPGD